MLTDTQALAVLQKAFPDAKVEPFIPYHGLLLFKVFEPDPEEGEFDPFYSVDPQNGEIKEFSILTDGNIEEINNIFLNQGD
jgi:hypothetical protein